MLRLFQPDVLDHLPAHQRRRGGRSCASRGGEISEEGAAIARTRRAKRAVKDSYESMEKWDETKGDCARSIQGSMGPAGPRSWINLVQRDETGNVGIRGWIDASGTL